MKCGECEVDVIDVQTKMHFRAFPAGEDWVEFPVLASVCPKCGKMDPNVAVPAQFARWVLNETPKNVRASLIEAF